MIPFLVICAGPVAILLYLRLVSKQLSNKLDTLMADQDQLDTEVQAIGTDFATAVTELKAQITANPTAPVSALDFSKLDALAAAVHAEATADAPPVPTPAS